MLKGPRNYYTRPRRRRTKHLNKKVLQKEKLKLVATTSEQAEGESNIEFSSNQTDSKTSREILENSQHKTYPCDIKLHHLDTDEPVLVSYSGRRRTILYKRCGTCSYFVKNFAARGRKKKRVRMNTKYNGDSRSKTGIPSTYGEERQSAPHPVPRKQCAKKSTSQLVRDFQPNRSKHSYSDQDSGRLPEKRQKLSDTYSSSRKYSSEYDRDRGPPPVNGEERSRSRERKYWQGEPARHDEQYHSQSRSQGGQRRAFSPTQDSRERFGSYDQRRNASYQSSGSSQQSSSDHSYHQRNAYRRGTYQRYGYANRGSSQEHVPRWRDGSLSNRGASYNSHFDRYGDKSNAKSASQSRDYSLDKSKANDTLSDVGKLGSGSGSQKEPRQLNKREASRDQEVDTKARATSPFRKDKIHSLQQESESVGVHGKEKIQPKSVVPANSDSSLSSKLDAHHTNRTSGSNNTGTPCDSSCESSSTLSETSSKNEPILTPSGKEADISSRAEISVRPPSPKSVLKKTADLNLLSGDKMEPLEAMGISNSTAGKPQLAPRRASPVPSAPSKEQHNPPKTTPDYDRKSPQRVNSPSSIQPVTENTDADLLKRLASGQTKPESTHHHSSISGSTEETCKFSDVRSNMGTSREGIGKTVGPSQIQASAKGVADQLDFETPEGGASSPARPVSSAKQTTDEDLKKSSATPTGSPPLREGSLNKPSPQSRSPSPLIKQDGSEGSLNVFFRHGRQKLKSIVDKVFPKANSSITKEDGTNPSKNVSLSPEALCINSAVEAPSQKLKPPKLSAHNHQVVQDFVSVEQNHSSSVVLDKSLNESKSLELFATSSNEAEAFSSDACTEEEASAVKSKLVSDVNDGTIETISDSSNMQIPDNERGISVPKLAPVKDPSKEAVDGIVHKNLQTCGPSSLTEDIPNNSDHDHHTNEVADSETALLTDKVDQCQLPGANQALIDRTNLPKISDEHSKSRLQTSPGETNSELLAVKEKTIIVDEIPPVSEASSLKLNDVEPMEISPPVSQELLGVNYTSANSEQAGEQDSATWNSVTNLKIINEVSLRDVSDICKTVSENHVENGHSSPVKDICPVKPPVPTVSESTPSPVTDEIAVSTDPEASGKAVSTSCIDVTLERREMEGVIQEADNPAPTELKTGLTDVKIGKRARTPTQDDETVAAETEVGSKKPKLVDASAESQKVDMKAGPAAFEDKKEPKEPTNYQNDQKSEHGSSTDQKVEVAVKRKAEEMESTAMQISDGSAQPKEKWAVSASLKTPSVDQASVVRAHSWQVPSSSLAPSKATAPMSKPVSQAAKAEPASAGMHHTVKDDPSKSKAAVLPRSSSASPSTVPTSQQGAPRSGQRDTKPKQISRKELRLMIERNAQTALQSRLKLLQRQLEVSSKGEQAWKERALELQTQLVAVQEELVKSREDRDSVKEEVSELLSHMEDFRKRLQNKGIGLESHSVATQYDIKDCQEHMTTETAKPTETPSSPEVQPEKPPEAQKTVSDALEIPHTGHQRLANEASRNTTAAADLPLSTKEPAEVEPTSPMDQTPATSPPASTDAPVVLPEAKSKLQATAEETAAVVVLEEKVSEKQPTAGGAQSTSHTPRTPPVKMVSLGIPETLKSDITAPVTKVTEPTPTVSAKVTAPTPTVGEVLASAGGASAKDATVTVTSTPFLPATTVPQAGATAKVVTSVAVTSTSGTHAEKVVAPTPAVVEVAASVASTPPKKAPTPEVKDTSSPAQVVSKQQVASSPRGKTPQTPSPCCPTPSPRTPTPSGRVPTPSSPQVAGSPRAVSPGSSAPAPPKPSQQNVSSTKAKLQTAMQILNAKRAGSSSQANTSATSEPECIDLTDDSEEPKASGVTGLPASKPSSGAAATTVPVPVSAQGTSKYKLPPPYSTQGSSTTQTQSGVPVSTQALSTRRPVPQSTSQPTSQSQPRPATQPAKARAQVPTQQQQQHPGVPPHLVAVTAPPNITVGSSRYPSPSQRSVSSRLPPMPSMQPTSSVLTGNPPQAAAPPPLKSTPLTTNTSVQLSNQAVISNLQTLVTSTGQAPVASMGSLPQGALPQQQIQGIGPLLQRSAAPIALQALGGVYFPTASQAGLPAARLPQPQVGRMQPNPITATQLTTIQQQQQQQLQQPQQQLQLQPVQQQQLQVQQQQQLFVQQLQQQQQHQMQQKIMQQQAQQQHHQQIQQQLMQQRIQQQQKARAAEEQRQQATQQQQLQLQMQQQQQANQAKQQQQQVQKAHSHQVQKRQQATIQQAIQKLQSVVVDRKKQLTLLEKEHLALQAKAQTREGASYRHRELGMQLRNIEAKKQEIQEDITKNIAMLQQHQHIMSGAPPATVNANPAPATKPSHPAPLPPLSLTSSKAPPKPELNITKVENGIVLSWNMTLDVTTSQIKVYHLYAYQESDTPPSTSLWKKIGEVQALPLPMACTLTMFQPGSVYHFAVCAVDMHGQAGPFSNPSTINLPRN